MGSLWVALPTCRDLTSGNFRLDLLITLSAA